MQKRWFSRPRFVGSRNTGSPLPMIHTWCSPVRVEYGSRAPSRSAIQSCAIHFLIDLHFCAGNSIHISNQYDSFTWVPADPGIYKSPDYVLLASVVGGELVKIDDVKLTTVFRFSGDGKRSACSWRLTISSPFWAFAGPRVEREVSCRREVVGV